MPKARFGIMNKKRRALNFKKFVKRKLKLTLSTFMIQKYFILS